jgi:hypothetical protein
MRVISCRLGCFAGAIGFPFTKAIGEYAASVVVLFHSGLKRLPFAGT